MTLSGKQISAIIVGLVVLFFLSMLVYNKMEEDKQVSVPGSTPSPVGSPPANVKDDQVSWLSKLEDEMGGAFHDIRRGAGMVKNKVDGHDLMHRSASSSAPLRESMVASISDAQWDLSGSEQLGHKKDLDTGVAEAYLVRTPVGPRYNTPTGPLVRIE